jgi:hypothetical protein
MKAQLELFEIQTPSYHGMTQEEAFQAFHEANPHVYENLRKLALEHYSQRPGDQIGMKYLFEILRYNYRTRTERPENEFALNNNFTAYYARLLMSQEPKLRGVFELRRQARNRLQRPGVRAPAV